ncbi:uncharacterized protein NPIL_313021 [Nephila pilipes]|uniref:Mutator-like transposase domain-containing protein n=1 Tax=Nephila pilipes TaxID=299642 RepID=A0A8X6QVQ2_NEPPI|nr:uncharacterized protein NPIL_313021 [Nephila pilipes]
MSSKSAHRSTDYRHKKRRFYGNQHSKAEALEPVAANVTSASSKKLCLGSSHYENYSTDTKGYILINLDNFLGEISKLLICCYCGSKVVLKERVLCGLVSEFYSEFDSCRTQYTFKSSPVLESHNHDYEINTRIIYAMRTVGIDLSGLKNFCSVMDLPPPVSQKFYDRILNNIKLASSIVADTSKMQQRKKFQQPKQMKYVSVGLNVENPWSYISYRCGKTQNSNKSFNSTVWKYCPKTSGASKTVVDIAVNEATVLYNDGMSCRLNILKCLGCKLGLFSITYASQADNARIKGAEAKLKSSTLHARRVRRMKRKAMHEHFVAVEGTTYEAGGF